MKFSLITGGAGFIAQHLVRALSEENRSFILVDNLSRGLEEYVSSLQKELGQGKVLFINHDISDYLGLKNLLQRSEVASLIDEVWHLAANSDIPAGVEAPDIDLKDTFLTTFSVLKLMKELNIGTLHFSSSSAVYGDFKGQPLTEAMGPLAPISNYGAMKLASEAQISACCESFLERANVFRFPNVVGVPATHGVLLDFIKKLEANPLELKVLGDGTQKKIYLHVSELVSAMLFIRKNNLDEKFNIFNIGPLDEGTTVSEIARLVVGLCSPAAEIIYQNERRGWVGDVPEFCYDISKIQKLGWNTTCTSRGSVLRALNEIIQSKNSFN